MRIGFSVTFTTRVEPCMSITTSENRPVENSAFSERSAAGGIVGLTFLELQVGADRLGLGADVALDLHGGDGAAGAGRRAAALSNGRLRRKPASRQRR